jgi:hypothetical protein
VGGGAGAAGLTGLDRVGLLERAAGAAFLADDKPRAAQLWRDALAGVDPATDPVRAGLLHERLGRSLWLTLDDAALDAYREAVRLVPAEPPSAERARVLFERATAELDPDRSAVLANQIDRKLWEGLPSIPLYQRPTVLAWRDTLRNVTENPTTEGPLWNAESWAFAGEATP